MGVIAKGILRGCQGLFTPVSLGYPLSVFNKNSTLKQSKVPGELPAEVPEDSRGLRERRLVFPTSDRLDTWLIPSAIAPIGQLHQSPPSPIPGNLGRGPSHQSHVLEHRDTYGQAQVCRKGHQGSSVDRPCQPSGSSCIKFWHVRNPLPQSIRLRLSVLVR